ncbi:UDP-glucosyltransferase 29-like [Lycium barbarum]|uniref:UDP-glucosyltransferase 29-like n=1 Tax=Lycium barbarum TaxID=112863 RepID=UPI00293EB5C7|nr:UDP-glucosyltransferase 29-like [Lycium barbarum]
MENMELMSNRPNVLMFPWLAHGHVSYFLELAKKLCQRNFDICICSTPMILSLIKESHGKNNNLPSIKLIELNLPSNIPEFPPEYHTTKVLPRHLVPKLVEAFNMAATSFYDIIKIHNPDLLIYDHFQLWAPEIASLYNIPSVHFCVIGAVTMSFASHHVLFKDKSFPHPAIYLRDFEKKKQRIAMQSSIKLVDKEFPCGSMKRSCDIVLINSCREIEGKYIDYLI